MRLFELLTLVRNFRNFSYSENLFKYNAINSFYVVVYTDIYAAVFLQYFSVIKSHKIMKRFF